MLVQTRSGRFGHTQYDARRWDTFLDLGFNKGVEIVAGLENAGPEWVQS